MVPLYYDNGVWIKGVSVVKQKKISPSDWKVVCPRRYRLQMEGNKWDIFCCAVHLFAEYDYSSITVRRIATEVGMKAPSIYNHFASKDELLSTMYTYLDHYALTNLKSLDYFLDRVQDEPPRELLYSTHFYYPPFMQDLMAKLILIAFRQMRTDERADRILRFILIENSQNYVGALLKKMIELDRIEPLDIEAFLELYNNNYYGASMRMYSTHPVDGEIWVRSFRMLFNHIIEKEKKE